MVRLAEGLDRSHAQALAGIDLYPRGDDYLARLRATGDAELELWAAHRHVAPLERVARQAVVSRLPGNDKEPSGYAHEPESWAARVAKPTRLRRSRRVDGPGSSATSRDCRQSGSERVGHPRSDDRVYTNFTLVKSTEIASGLRWRNCG